MPAEATDYLTQLLSAMASASDALCARVLAHAARGAFWRFARGADAARAGAFWRLARRLCGCPAADARLAAFLVESVALLCRASEPPVQAEMLGVLARACLPLREKWAQMVAALRLELFVSDSLGGSDPALLKGAVCCFVKLIAHFRPLDGQLVALLEILKKPDLLGVASFAIVEVLRLYPDAADFFVDRGVVQTVIKVFANCMFAAKTDGILVLCAVTIATAESNFDVFFENGVLELFLEVLETTPPMGVRVAICRAVLTLALAADAVGNRDGFVEGFRHADGDTVMTNLCYNDGATVSLIGRLRKWYFADPE
jgi:hypothetical protein